MDYLVPLLLLGLVLLCVVAFPLYYLYILYKVFRAAESKWLKAACVVFAFLTLLFVGFVVMAVA